MGGNAVTDGNNCTRTGTACAGTSKCVTVDDGMLVVQSTDSVCNTADKCKCRPHVADGDNCSITNNNCNASTPSRCIEVATNAFVTVANNNTTTCATAGNCKCRTPIASGLPCDVT